MESKGTSIDAQKKDKIGSWGLEEINQAEMRFSSGTGLVYEGAERSHALCLSSLRSLPEIPVYRLAQDVLDMYNTFTLEPLHTLLLYMPNVGKQCAICYVRPEQLLIRSLRRKEWLRACLYIQKAVPQAWNRILVIIEHDSRIFGVKIDRPGTLAHLALKSLYTNDRLWRFLKRTE